VGARFSVRFIIVEEWAAPIFLGFVYFISLKLANRFPWQFRRDLLSRNEQKPFSPREVVARVRALLRRATVLSGGNNEIDVLRFPSLEIHPREYRVVAGGREVSLQAREFELLRFLALHPRQVFGKDQIFVRHALVYLFLTGALLLLGLVLYTALIRLAEKRYPQI